MSTTPSTPRPRLRSGWIGMAFGVVAGATYGVLARGVESIGGDAFIESFIMMTLSFLGGVPLVAGVLTVLPAERPRVLYRLFAPWLSVLLAAAAAAVIGWEGSICLIMGLPVMLVASSVGGLLGGLLGGRRKTAALALVFAPWGMSRAELATDAPTSVRIVREVIDVAAPADVVWSQVVEVPRIRRDEMRPALFTAIGFPAPVSATTLGRGVGAVRHARFEGGVLFVETVTAWDEGRLLAFAVDAQEETIPATTLDPHVAIGGPFFDVLEGRYEIEPLSGDRTRVALTSRTRVSTRFNAYASPWSDAVMRSVQRSILDVVRDRCEADAARRRM